MESTLDKAIDTSPILDEAAALLCQLYSNRLESLAVERLVVGVFFTGVQFSGGHVGVAYTPPEMVHRASTRILRAQRPHFRGMLAKDVLRGGLPGPFAEVIRLAALNALSAPYLTYGRYPLADDDDLSKIPKLFTGRRVAMVGAIVPLLRKIHELAPSDILIIDKKEETKAEFANGHFIPVEQTQSALGQCETAVLTGASIANGTIGALLSYLPKSAAIAVVGPTASFVPEPLFARGIAMVGTSVVTDGDQAMDVVSEGEGAYQLFKNCVRKINLLNPAWMTHLTH